jgi:hypothetical protein
MERLAPPRSVNAISVHLIRGSLIAIVKKRLTLTASLYTLLQVFSVSLFERIPIESALALEIPTSEIASSSNQLNLFGF